MAKTYGNEAGSAVEVIENKTKNITIMAWLEYNLPLLNDDGLMIVWCALRSSYVCDAANLVKVLNLCSAF